jgi:glycerophosphoryl diester phosphodiesterase
MLRSLPGNYTDAVVPTLEDLMRLLKKYEETEIQIELKPTKDDRHLEEEVVRLIHAYDMKDRCYVISMNHDSLLKIKELDPEIRTGVIVMAAWDTYADEPGADVLSAADSAVSPDLVRAMHQRGIKVMVWTVDDIDAVQYLVSCGVDVIGTNDPLVIQSGTDLANTDGGAARILYVLLHMFRSADDSSLMKGKAS